MRKSILTLSAAMLLIVASCSKSNETPTEETKTCLTSQVILDGGTSTDGFTYDQNGNVTKWTFDGNKEETYTYTSSAITLKNGISYQLAQGRITSMNGSYTTTYTYNGEGYLTEVRSSITTGGTTTISLDKFTWTNGNMVKSESSVNNVVMQIVNYEYNADTRPSNFMDYYYFVDFDVALQKYFGKQPKNLISKATSNGNVVTYKYTKDSDGNVATSASTEVGYGDDVITYKYSCK